MLRSSILFLSLIFCTCLFAQNFEQQVLSDFERAVNNSKEAVILDFGLIGSFPSFLGNEFLQVHTVKAKRIDGTPINKTALVISHSPHRKNIGVRDYIDADEIDSLIRALEYYRDTLLDKDSNYDQSYTWTSRGGYQFRADFVQFPKRHSAFSRMNNFNANKSLAMLSNKRIDEFINNIIKVRSFIKAQ